MFEYITYSLNSQTITIVRVEMTIHDASSLVGHILIIEKLVEKIKIKRPHLNDQQAFALAHAMIERFQNS